MAAGDVFTFGPFTLDTKRKRLTKGHETIGLTGRDGGKLGSASQLNIQVAHPHMGRIEDAHLIVCHMICYRFMELN